MQKPLKPYLPTADLIQKLTDRGMALDPGLAERWLDVVGYYRLSGYWYTYRKLDPAGGIQRLDTFLPGTSFGDIAALYEFDRKL
jgi:abortive infection bacteriophage resistance protein